MDIEGNKIKYPDVEELTSLARRYYATRFPNSQRIGCPPHGEIDKIVGRRRIPDQALRSHLFECSECFGEYRQALAQRRQPAPDENAALKRRLWVLRISLVSAALILAALAVGIWPKPEPEAAKETAQGSNLQEARAVDGAEPAPSQTDAVQTDAVQTDAVRIAEERKPPDNDLAVVGRSRSSPGPRIIDVDLDDYRNSRQPSNEKPANVSEDQSGREGARPHEGRVVETYGPPSGENIISLPSRRASLILRLPETGARGKYNVSFIDAYGKTLWSTSAYSHDGSKLRVPFNLRRISSRKCRLRLARNGEAPAYYNVIIGDK